MVKIAHAVENMLLTTTKLELGSWFGLDTSVLLLVKKSCTTYIRYAGFILFLSC